MRGLQLTLELDRYQLASHQLCSVHYHTSSAFAEAVLLSRALWVKEKEKDRILPWIHHSTHRQQRPVGPEAVAEVHLFSFRFGAPDLPLLHRVVTQYASDFLGVRTIKSSDSYGRSPAVLPMMMMMMETMHEAIQHEKVLADWLAGWL